MRPVSFAAIAAAMLALTAAPAMACCGSPAYYGAPAVDYAVVPVVPVNPFYIVNEGPIFSGPGIYAYDNVYVPSVLRPAHWNGVYADGLPYVPYAHPYPYVRSSHAWHCRCGGRGYAHARYGYRVHRYEAPRAYVIGMPPFGG